MGALKKIESKESDNGADQAKPVRPDSRLVTMAEHCSWTEEHAAIILMGAFSAFVAIMMLSNMSPEKNPVAIVFAFLFAALAVFVIGLPFWLISDAKKRFRERLSTLSFDQLKVELEAHPTWLKYVSAHTNEMAMQFSERLTTFSLEQLEAELKAYPAWLGYLPRHTAEMTSRFQATLAKLSFEQLKVELEAHPAWLQYLPQHTEEMAIIAIAADPTAIRYTRYNSFEFWLNVARVHKAMAADRLKSPNSDGCRVWQEILKIDPAVFLEKAPQRFPHLEYEIYLDLVKLNPDYIHRVPTFQLQDRIRMELNRAD